jgi:hypothetical protein
MILKFYFQRAVKKHPKAPRNWTNPITSWPKLFNPTCIVIYRAHLKRLKRQGRPITNFYIVIKSFHRQKSKKPVETSKASEIPPQRDSDTNTKVIRLRKHYQNGSYIYHPTFKKLIIFKRLKLREFAPICKEINPINQYRFMDFIFHLDASCLNEN